MTRDKWLDTIYNLKQKFSVLEEREEELPDNVPGMREIVVFSLPNLGKVKLEWTKKAKLQGEKTLYSGRVGSFVKVDKVYDEQEFVSYLKAYLWNTTKDDWQEVEMEKTFSF